MNEQPEDKKKDYRPITEEQLSVVLKKHREYLDSDGQAGATAWLRCVDLQEADLRGVNLQKADLRDANLQEADLRGADLQKADLQDADLQKAHLRGANLQEANLFGANLRKAHLSDANLQEADLFGANLQKAHLIGANLQEANLWTANLQEADLFGANLRKANLRDADLRKAILWGASFKEACVAGIKYDVFAEYRGIRVDSCYGSPRFKRFAQDQDWLAEFEATRTSFPQRLLARLWKWSCNYGQSFSRWAILSIGFAVIFAILYMPFFPFGPQFEQLPSAYQCKPITFPDTLYFSIVTFTTLGFGDIQAANLFARILVGIEVVIGYLMLGGLIAILAQKIARRS